MVLSAEHDKALQLMPTTDSELTVTMVIKVQQTPTQVLVSIVLFFRDRVFVCSTGCPGVYM